MRDSVTRMPKDAQQVSIAPLLLTALIVGLIDCGLWFMGKGDLLRAAIPAGAACVGLAFYLIRPVGYVSFALWTWLLAPLVRRIVDYRFGFTDPNIILLTPHLTSLIAGLGLLRLRRTQLSLLSPFWLCAAGVLYGLIVGIVSSIVHAPDSVPIFEVFYGCVNWVAPILLGLFLFTESHRYAAHRDQIQRTLLWATFLLGCYALMQYVNPPEWDKYWLESLRPESSTWGRPYPFEIRVWSTLNAPGPFADFVMAGLLYAFTVRSRWKLPALAVGLCSFALTLVRTSWIILPISGFIALRSTRRSMRTLILSITPLVVLAAALFLFPKVTAIESIRERFETMASLQGDESAQDRLEMYGRLAGEVSSLPFGIGLNNETLYHGYALDSGLVQILLNLGFVGTGLYLGGILWITILQFRRQLPFDSFASVGKGILVGSLIQLAGSPVFIGIQGVIVWLAIGTCLSSVPLRQHGERKERNRVPLTLSATSS